MNSYQITTIQEKLDEKKIKCVAFCLEQNEIYPIYKSSNEYLTKKQKRKLARRVSRALRGKGTEDTTSSEEEIIIDDETETYYSIVEWKQLQDRTKKTENQQHEKKDKIKSALKKSCLINQNFQKDLIAAYEDILREEQCQEQMETQLDKQKKIDKTYIISDFAEIQKDNEISITLDELEDFGFYCPQKYDISDFDQIKKKIDKEHNIIQNLLQKPQIDQSIFTTSNYSLPKSDQGVTRLKENISRLGITYCQFTIAVVLLGGITNLTFLLSVGISIALWYAILKNEETLDFIPNFGMLTTDKKKVVLFLLNVLVLYILCGDSIFTYIGIGFLISFIHAFLFVSPSTGALIDGQDQPQANEDLSQYANFDNNKNVELQMK